MQCRFELQACARLKTYGERVRVVALILPEQSCSTSFGREPTGPWSGYEANARTNQPYGCMNMDPKRSISESCQSPNSAWCRRLRSRNKSGSAKEALLKRACKKKKCEYCPVDSNTDRPVGRILSQPAILVNQGISCRGKVKRASKTTGDVILIRASHPLKPPAAANRTTRSW